MPLDLNICTGSNTPIYRQIIDQICRAIADGSLGEGDQVPSVRALAEQLVINPNTVARTYGDLIRDGILEAQKGRGVFVAKRRNVYTRSERLRRLQSPLDAFVNGALFLGFSAEEIRDVVEQRLKQLEPARTRGGNAHGD